MKPTYFLALILAAGLLLGCRQQPATQVATTPAATLAASPVPPTATAEPSVTPLPLAGSDFLAKPDGALRFVSFNINWDSIFPFNDPQSHDLRFFDRSAAFLRIMQALNPDVVCLQEINPARDPAEVAAYLDAAIDVDGDEDWGVVLVRDTLIASRFEIDQSGYEMAVSRNIPNLEQAAVLVDLRDEQYGPADLFVICAHFKSGSNIADERMRQRQADVLMGHVRDAQAAGSLAAGTPIVIAGDFNLYDLDEAAFLPTLVEGDLASEAIYGEDFWPDWDASALTDLLPSHNGLGVDIYTWRDDGEPFAPGALDHIIYSDSVLHPANAFVLNTTQMTQAGLEAAGLRANDVLLDAARLNFDHLPLVVDFTLAVSE